MDVALRSATLRLRITPYWHRYDRTTASTTKSHISRNTWLPHACKKNGKIAHLLTGVHCVWLLASPRFHAAYKGAKTESTFARIELRQCEATPSPFLSTNNSKAKPRAPQSFFSTNHQLFDLNLAQKWCSNLHGCCFFCCNTTSFKTLGVFN